jgi:uncharacterized SAM-binding protein YcdF (DUF218 family)
MWIAAGVFGVLFAFRLWRDPRTFRAGLYLTGMVFSAGVAASSEVLRELVRERPMVAGWVLLGLALATVGTVVVLGFVLIANGVVMVRREGISPAHLLSLGAGCALLAFIGAWVWAFSDSAHLSVLILFAALFPAAYFGVGMVSYLLYGRLYRTIAPTMSALPQAVIVLGAGLAGGRRVTPLLAARLDRGLAVAARTRARGGDPVVVASGGRGPDEDIPEAQAMSAYLLAKGFDETRLLLEERSRNTKENLAFSRVLLAEHGITGPVAAVSSNYHVFRTAMLMRRAGLAGYATGSPVARYYWPSAAIREFVATCVEHLPATLIGLILVCSPVWILAIYQFTLMGR